MADERHFTNDDEMDDWLEDEAADHFDELPLASAQEMPPGGGVAIVISSAAVTEATGVGSYTQAELLAQTA